MQIQSCNNNVNFGSLQRILYPEAMYGYSKNLCRYLDSSIRKSEPIKKLGKEYDFDAKVSFVPDLLCLWVKNGFLCSVTLHPIKCKSAKDFCKKISNFFCKNKNSEKYSNLPAKIYIKLGVIEESKTFDEHCAVIDWEMRHTSYSEFIHEIYKKGGYSLEEYEKRRDALKIDDLPYPLREFPHLVSDRYK